MTTPRQRWVSIVALSGTACGCVSKLPYNTFEPHSDFAKTIFNLYWEVIGWDTLILVLVATLICLVLFKFSSRPGDSREPVVPGKESLALEVAWTLGPAGILLLIALPAIVVNFRTQPKPPADALEVVVTAHQWWWEFSYPQLGIVTANEAHVPVNRTIDWQLISGDVIHSFWVPQLGGKRDVIPGHRNSLIMTPDTVGEFFGECAEFCGLSHASMHFRVFVDRKADFAQWTATQKGGGVNRVMATGDQAKLRAGAQVFANSPCTSCHTIDGVSSGYIGPNLSHFGSRTTLAAAMLRNTPENLAKWIENPQREKPGVLMPPLALSKPDLQNLVAYLESLK